MRTFKTHKQKPLAQPARVGDVVTVRGVRCRIFRIHPAGTVDVEEIDGNRAWRLSGLPVK